MGADFIEGIKIVRRGDLRVHRQNIGHPWVGVRAVADRDRLHNARQKSVITLLIIHRVQPLKDIGLVSQQVIRARIASDFKDTFELV